MLWRYCDDTTRPLSQQRPSPLVRLSSGFPQTVVCKSPRVSQLQANVSTTPANKSASVDACDSPLSIDGSLDVLDQPVCSPTLSLRDESIVKDRLHTTGAGAGENAPPPEVVPIDLEDSLHDATSTEANDMDLTDAEVAPPPLQPPATSDNDDDALGDVLGEDPFSKPEVIPVNMEDVVVDGGGASSSINDASGDSLITPFERRTSSFVRLYTTPPDEEPKR